jgi:hypothetical protein
LFGSDTLAAQFLEQASWYLLCTSKKHQLAYRALQAVQFLEQASFDAAFKVKFGGLTS